MCFCRVSRDQWVTSKWWVDAFGCEQGMHGFKVMYQALSEANGGQVPEHMLVSDGSVFLHGMLYAVITCMLDLERAWP